MSAAHPLPIPEDDLQEKPLDGACLASLCPEERALAEAALARLAGGTVQAVPHAEVLRRIDEQRR